MTGAPRIAELGPLADPRVGVGRDFAADSQTMFLLFSTMSEGVAPPAFEFLAASARLQVRRLFLRDPGGVWYHRGIPGLGDRIDIAAASLSAIRDEQGIERLIAIGYSAGGYAALLFGALLGADRVIALEPQTCLEREWLSEIGDDRWDAALDRLDEGGGADPGYLDLRSVLAPARAPATSFEVHYNALFPADEHHALRLTGLPGVELRKRAPDGRNIVRSLRAGGELEEMFAEAAAVRRP
jgi:pimeloyl-ACP methyl ester carboxylesterase